jgi:hypothetical protein
MVGVALGTPQTARSVNEICERTPLAKNIFNFFSKALAVQGKSSRKEKRIQALR